VDTSRENFDVLAIANQTAKKPFRDRAATNITCADKKDAFHDSGTRSERVSQPRIEQSQVNFAGGASRNDGLGSRRFQHDGWEAVTP
jgi:hypothetical protein